MFVNSLYNIQTNQTFKSNIAPNKLLSDSKAIVQKSVKSYLEAKSLPQVNFEPTELKCLFQIKDSEDFIQTAFNSFIKKLNIPAKIAPKLIYQNCDASFIFGYDKTINNILINTSYEIPKYKDILVLFRHEFQHFLQNINLLRHEELGKKHLQNIYNLYISDYNEKLLETLKMHPSSWQVDFKSFKNLYLMKNYLNNNDKQSFDTEFNKIKKTVKKDLKSFRKKVINCLGTINSNDKRTENLTKICEGTRKTDYSEKQNWAEYLTNPAEYEATLAEYLFQANLENQCFINFLNNITEEFLNSEHPEDIKIKTQLTELLSQKPNTDFAIPNLI